MKLKISFSPDEIGIIDQILKDNDNSMQFLKNVALKIKFKSQTKRKFKVKVHLNIEEWRAINKYLGEKEIKTDSLNGYELISKKIIEKGVEKALRYSELLEC